MAPIKNQPKALRPLCPAHIAPSIAGINSANKITHKMINSVVPNPNIISLTPNHRNLRQAEQLVPTSIMKNWLDQSRPATNLTGLTITRFFAFSRTVSTGSWIVIRKNQLTTSMTCLARF